MNREDVQPTVEQSWIVLDDNGWVSASRPPTASPSRARLADDDDEDNQENRVARRVGMDRDVREALELAERSLELAGSIDEFSRRRDHSDDEASTPQRSSPLSYRSTFNNAAISEDSRDDPYNGRAPPMAGGSRRGNIIIATDSEHVAFQNIRLVSSTPRPETPILGASPFAKEVVPRSASYISQLNLNRPTTDEVDARETVPVRSPKSGIHDRSAKPDEEENENDRSLLQWMFGISGHSNIVPLVLSHAVTLLIGFYFGTRRSSIASSSATTSSSNVSTGIQCPAGA